MANRRDGTPVRPRCLVAIERPAPGSPGRRGARLPGPVATRQFHGLALVQQQPRPGQQRRQQAADSRARPWCSRTCRGPGVVTHMWVTVAANEYGWPRLLRLRVYYDGSADAQRGRAARRFLRRRPRLRAAGRFAAGPRQLRAAGRATATGRCRSASRAGSRSPTRAGGASRTSTTTWTGRRCRALPPEHRLFPRALPAGAARAAAGTALRVSSTSRAEATTSARCFSVVQAEPGWFGEGDDLFYVDGEKRAVASRGPARRTISTTRGACAWRTARTRACPSRRAPAWAPA